MGGTSTRRCSERLRSSFHGNGSSLICLQSCDTTPDLLGCFRTCSSLRTRNRSSGFVGFALGCWSWTRTWFGLLTGLLSSGSTKNLPLCLLWTLEEGRFPRDSSLSSADLRSVGPGVFGSGTSCEKTDVSEPRCCLGFLHRSSAVVPLPAGPIWTSGGSDLWVWT